MVKYDAKAWLSVTFAWHGTALIRIWPRAALLIGIAVAVVLAHLLFPAFPPEIPPLGHTLIGVALGLLLVFRNNASYERYWEGRKCWGSILNIARNLARAGAAWTRRADDLARLLSAYVVAVREQLRAMGEGIQGVQEFERFLRPAEKAEVLKAENAPSIVALYMSLWVRENRESGRLDSYQATWMETLIAQLLDNQGACERIVKTPIPFCLASHLKQLLFVYLVTLPIVLAPNHHWTGVLVTGIISFGLIGIEEAGVEIEDPFGTDPNDLPLEEICGTIARQSQAIADLGKSTPPSGAEAPRA